MIMIRRERRRRGFEESLSFLGRFDNDDEVDEEDDKDDHDKKRGLTMIMTMIMRMIKMIMIRREKRR